MGAFEAGALHYTLDTLAREIGHPPRFNLFTGTSVGAINASFLAARARDLAQASRDLVAYWESLTIEQILRFRTRELGALLHLLIGGSLKPSFLRPQRPWRHGSRATHPPVAGLFDTTPLYRQMEHTIPWGALQDNIARGLVRGIALCATEICTGTSIIFHQTAAGTTFKTGRDPLKEARAVKISVDHLMASSAMPFLFPSVQINGVCYTDGALRQNTPLNPALRMGADRILVISLNQPPSVASGIARLGCQRNPYPGVLFLLGKTAHIFLTQSLDYELNRVEMYNKLIKGGCATYGPGFVQAINHIMGGQRNATYRTVGTCHIRPSRSLHRLAIRALQEAPEEFVFPGLPGRLVSQILGSSAFAESELLGLLMFTPTYIRALLDLGRRDAEANRESLLELFAD